MQEPLQEMGDYDHDDWQNDERQTSLIVGSVVFLVLSAAFSIWIMQNSVNAYFMQTYHKQSPIAQISHPFWLKGGEIGLMLYENYDIVKKDIHDVNQQIVDNFNENYAYTPYFKAMLIEKQKQEALRLAKEKELKAQQLLADQKQTKIQKSLSINKTQKVFFAGDSMMQGIAPHIQKYLQDLGIQSLNLSKQSTGLAYPKFFDWQSTIKQTIDKNKDIKVLIVMLGPNDPWDMPASNGRYLKFGTSEWNDEYQSRITDIINFAKEHHVGVIWVTPPNMKKDKLNEQMNLLNTVIAQELARHDVKMIDSRPIMGGVNNSYNDYLTKDGKQIKMRSGDGIHFSPDGQKILAQEVQSQLIIE